MAKGGAGVRPRRPAWSRSDETNNRFAPCVRSVAWPRTTAEIWANSAAAAGANVCSSTPFEGGLRDAEVRRARSWAGAAADDLQRIQTAAVTEATAARNALRTALESHVAAKALAAAETTTYDAAFAAYSNGVSTIDAATETDIALLDAREAQAEAHAAALVGAVNLAFVAGALTSADNLP